MLFEMSFEESLIALVRDREFIYNTKLKQYKNTTKRFEAWEEIGRLLERPADDCKQRWKSLRDRFVREKRSKDLPSGSAARSRDEWELYASLEFLIPSISTRRQTGNYATRADENTPDWSDPNENQLEEEAATPRRGKKRQAADNDFKNFLNGLSTAMIPFSGLPPILDTDEEFMLNMAKRMKPLPEEAKMRLHSKILGEINSELLRNIK